MDRGKTSAKQPDSTFSAWLVIDQAGEVHARIEGARFEVARAIARATFPELAGRCRLVPPSRAAREQLCTARGRIVLTPDRCRKQGLLGSSVDWAARLQKHFARTAGGVQ